MPIRRQSKKSSSVSSKRRPTLSRSVSGRKVGSRSVSARSIGRSVGRAISGISGRTIGGRSASSRSATTRSPMSAKRGFAALSLQKRKAISRKGARARKSA